MEHCNYSMCIKWKTIRIYKTNKDKVLDTHIIEKKKEDKLY